MFRSRASSRGSRTPFRRRRFRSVTDKKMSRPKVWQWANFNIQNVLSPDGFGAAQNVVTVLAQINDRLGDDGATPGRALKGAVKRLELGGIVWNAGVDTDFIDPSQLVSQEARSVQMIWAFDRLDALSQPGSITTPWQLSMPPVVAIDATTFPLADEDESNYPTRVVRRFADVHEYGVFLDVDSKVAQGVTRSRWSGNLRLRQFLDEDHALVLHQFAHNEFGFGSSVDAVFTRFWCIGSLYYRWRF